MRVTLGSVLITDFDTSRRAQGGRASSALDVDFRVDRETKPGPQSSELTVYGLSQRTRDILTRAVADARERSYFEAQALRSATIQIYAGRPGNTRLLSDDWILEVPIHTRDGADWVTTIKCQDGRLPWASAFIHETRQAEPDPAALARGQQEALGLLGEGAEALAVDPQLVAEGFGRIRGSVASFGAPRSNEQTLRLLNRVPIFQRGKIQWIRADQAQIFPAVRLIEGRTALTISEAKAYGYREVTAPLDARLELGRQIFILRRDGRELGPFRVDAVTAVGSTRGPEWTSTLTLRPTSGAAQLAEVVG